jgi:hypothetical protein
LTSVREYVKGLVPELLASPTVRTACPVCKGADTFTASLVDGAILYNCYRASCDRRESTGNLYLRLSLEDRARLFHAKQAVAPSGDTEPEGWQVPPYWIDGIGGSDCLAYMEANHLMPAYKAGLFRPMYDPALRRFIFPLLAEPADHSGAGIKNNRINIIGAIGRSLIGESPKVLNYNSKIQQPFIVGNFKKCLVVEDCASAVAATREGYTGIALLGTNLKKEFIASISRWEWVGVALDPDAYGKSFRMKKILDSYCKHVVIVRLPDDIKNLSDDEFKKVMNRYVR